MEISQFSFQSPMLKSFSSSTKVSGFTVFNEGMAIEGATYMLISMLLFRGHIGAMLRGIWL